MNKPLLKISFFIFIHVILIVFISFIGFYFKFDFLSHAFISSFILLLAAFLFFSKERFWVSLFSTESHSFLTSILLSYTISILISGVIYDVSWDGQDYHFLSIERLLQGWNPVQQPKVESPWTTGYPKFSWILAASISSFTGNIETGKAFNFLFIEASFFLSLLFLKQFDFYTGLSKHLIFTICFLLAFNPISTTQAFSNMQDGQMSSILLCLIISIILYIKTNKACFLALQTLCFLSLSNIKFTGLVYSCITMFIIGLFYLVSRNKEQLKTHTIQLLVTGLGIFLIGFNPYITNLVTFGNSLYPLSESSYATFVELHTGAKAPIVANGDRLTNLLKSISTLPSNNAVETKYLPIYQASPIELIKSLTNYAKAGVRFNGFGILFGLGLLLSCFPLVHLLAKPVHNVHILVPLSIILTTTFINPAIWMARYIPQFYYLPVLVLIPFIYKGYTKARFINFIIIILLTNQLILLTINFGYNIYATTKYNSFLSHYRNNKETLLVLEEYSDVNFPALPYRLNKNDITFITKERGYCKKAGKEILEIAPMGPLPAICTIK